MGPKSHGEGHAPLGENDRASMPVLPSDAFAKAAVDLRLAAATLVVALLFAAIFRYVRSATRVPGPRAFSFAAGTSLAYTFIHVIPALHGIREVHTDFPGEFRRVFPEYSVYLWTMAGFLVFYGLQILAERKSDGTTRETAWRSWVEIGGFLLYVWLLAFLMVWTGKRAIALALYALAMSMHLAPVAWNLRTHFPDAYRKSGAHLLGIAALAGWAGAVVLDLPAAILLDLVAFVAGGVIVNSTITELHREREGRYLYLVAGAAVYTALLLVLSHFE